MTGSDAEARATARVRRPTRIAFTLHELGQGGTDRVGIHLARGFAEHGFDVELIVLFGAAPAAPAMLSLLGERVTVSVLDDRPGSRHVDRLAALPRLVSRLRASRPDVVMSTGNNMNWITALAFRLSGLPRSRLVLKMTNPVIRDKDGVFRRGYRRARYRAAFARSDLVLTLCDRETDELRAMFPALGDRAQSVINPYVTPEMLTCHDDVEIGGRHVVLAIGRLVPQKRFDLLIRAFAQVTVPDARLVILGEGPERPSLEALARGLGLGDRVVMPGYVADIAPWLRQARLFALCSRYEGLPGVVLEAMAAGCPIVSTRCFLAAESLVEGVEGCAVVDGATPAAFARALDRSWSTPRSPVLPVIARRFSIAAGVRSHLKAVQALLDGTGIRGPGACRGEAGLSAGSAIEVKKS